MEKLNGVVNRIIFSSETGFVVAELIAGGDEVVACGNLLGLHEGAQVELEGDWVEHPTYGRQFKSSSFREVEPQDEISIERYLGSGAVSGIGIKMAARIVRRFGKDTLRIIEEEPERLAEIKGISMKKAMDISSQIEAGKSLREAMMYLQELGISVNMAAKIYNKYQNQIFTILRDNPYRLADEVDGIGFKTADEIAMRAGISMDSEFRIKSGIIYVLNLASGEGHTYLGRAELIVKSGQILDVDQGLIEKCLMDLSIDRKIVNERVNIGEPTEEDRIYSSVFFNMETRVADMLHTLDGRLEIDEKNIERAIKTVEKTTNIQLEGLQKETVEKAAKRGLLVVTGGPGTGKTTIIDAIIKVLELQGLDFLLAAPTGRAAKRMSEATGYEARTIHRLLEVGGIEGVDGFGRDETNPLETDAIIIDEMSMVDLPLMYALLKAILPGTRLILVGDANQLPSVGAGRILYDIIESRVYPVVKLTEVFRQAKESDIVMNAHRINNGEKLTLDNKSKDFFFLKRADSQSAIYTVLELVLKKLPPYVGVRPADVQVLCPMRKGLLGVDNLNIQLQGYINPAAPEKNEYVRGQVIYREGDKVMQTKNNYNLEWEIRGKYGISIESGKGIFNGDVGIIKTIDSFTKLITVEFDDARMVDYTYADMDELELAYATTIHKSQGSEYAAVVIPIMGTARPLQTRNLIYTAVTRAKQCVTIVGDESEFSYMVSNADGYRRNSGLIDKIEKRINAFD